MDNSSTDTQMQLQTLAHEVCRSHSARPERDLYRICPSKLSKRELEDLYFALLENNIDLKRTINSQNDKLKMLSTKVQRLSASKTMGSKDKDCCHNKTLINEQKDSITDLKKCNERMTERIRVLNMRLCSAKQFLKKQQPEQKNINKSQSKNSGSFQKFKNVCDHSQLKPQQPAIEYKISKSNEASPNNPVVTESPKPESSHQCNENKCKTAIEELQHKISDLQEELHLSQYNYASKLHNLENEIRTLMEENVRARAETRTLEERGDALVGRLRAAEGRAADLETQLAIEKLKVKELETRLKLADSDKNLAKSLDHLTVITEKRDSDASAQPSYKFRPRQSISEPKNESDVDSAVSYYKPQVKESESSVKSVKEPKRSKHEVEPLGSSQKNNRKGSQSSIKIKERKRSEPKADSLVPVSSQKSYQKESQSSVKINEPKPRENKVELEILKNEHEEKPPIPPSKGQRKQSIAEPKPRENKVEPEILKNELEKAPPMSPSKGRRKQSIEETKPRDSKTKHELSPILAHVPHRKPSLASVKLEVPKPKKPSYEVKFPKSDDSGYIDPNKSFDVEPDKDEEMLRINRELLKKIADLKSQLDLLMIAAAGAKQDELAPALSKPSAAETKMMEDHSVPTKSLSTHSIKVPNKIEPKQQVQAKTEDKVKRTTSSVKPEVVQNVGQIPKQLPNEDNLPKNIPNEDKEQKPFSYKDHADNTFASDKNKPLVDEKSPILYEDQIEQPISYEIRVPRSSLYPELIQKVPQKIQEAKSQPNEENDAIPSSYEDKVSMPEPFEETIPMSSTNESKIQEPPLIDGKTQRPYPEQPSRPSSADAVKLPKKKKLSVTSYDDTSTNLLSYQESLSTSAPYLGKAQNPPPFDYEVPRENRLPSYHPYGYEGRKPSFGENIQDPVLYEDKRLKSQLYEDKKLNLEEKKHHKDIVDTKRESLFYKDVVSDFDVDVDNVEKPNVDKGRDLLFYEKVQTPAFPFEDKIYPDEPQSIDDRTRTSNQYLRPKQEHFEEKRRPSGYAEQIQKFALDKNTPTTSSPYEEKMQKFNNEKQHPEDDTKSIRFESYIHMAENGSKDDVPDYVKYDEDPNEYDPNNLPKEKRRESSIISTNKSDYPNGFQIPGPIPSTPRPTSIDKKKQRYSVDITKKGNPEEKSVKILENVPSGYSCFFDKSTTSKTDSAIITDDVNKDKKDVKKSKGISISDIDIDNKSRASTDFSQVTDNPKEIKDMYQNTSYNNKTPQEESYLDMVREGTDIPPSAMQEQGTQIDPRIAWCPAGARMCTCPPGPQITAPLRTCSGTKRPAPSHMRYCACCNDKNLQAPAGPPRRDSATYTQTDTQPQTYTIPKDAYTQPRRESLDQKTYTQNGTQENPQQKAYQRDTYTQVGPQTAQTPRYSRSTSPDNTDKEISSLPDLPQEREMKPTNGYLSPGEKATMTFTDNETNTDYGTLSEGELPSTRKATKSFGEKGVETTSTPEERPTQRMEEVLKSISDELARCHRLLASQKREERNTNEANKPSEDEGVQLRASQGARRLTGAHHVCVFTLHVGTLVLSDEAVLQSQDKSLVLMWRFYDQSVTMTRMHAGRVVLFDFSTEYDVVFSEDFLNYMKFEKMPLLVCEINKQDKPYATCYLPLRDALLHVNRRADMSLALTDGPGGDESSSEELGVLDLWCVLRCDAMITQHLTKSMARPSTGNMSPRRSYHHSILEEDLSNERMSEDLDLNIKNESRAQDTLTEQMPMNNKKSYSGYYPPAQDGGSYVGDAANDDLSTSNAKMNRRRSSLLHPRPTFERKDVSFDGNSNWAANKGANNDGTGFIANAVPSKIRSTEEMKAALELNARQEENRKMPKSDEKSLSRKNQLSKLKFTKKLSEDAIGSLQALISSRPAIDRKNSQPKYELPPVDKTENELAKKYNDISKLMVSRMDAAKKSVKYYSQDDGQPQRIQGTRGADPSPQSIEITVLWLALNEECEAMINPDIKRLYVAYKFLGRNGAELETPVSLPKPKHYVDKCFFNFKKTFHLHDADLPALGHMARVRAGSRVSTDPRDCLVFTVVSEPPEDPLGLASCEDVGYAYLYLGDILAYASGSGAYTEVVAVHAARGSAVCGVLAVKIDGLHVLRRALTLSHSTKDMVRPAMAY